MEKVYKNALVVELRSLGLAVEQQKPINVYYRDILVGEFYATSLSTVRLSLNLSRQNL